MASAWPPALALEEDLVPGTRLGSPFSCLIPQHTLAGRSGCISVSFLRGHFEMTTVLPKPLASPLQADSRFLAGLKHLVSMWLPQED